MSLKLYYQDKTPFYGIFREIPMSGQTTKEKMDPLYTIKEHDDELLSAHKIYMGCPSEYDAAIKLVGSWRWWNRMIGSSSKIRKLIEDWRDEKLLKDQANARKLLWIEAEKGNVAAQKVLYESKKEEAEQKKREKDQTAQDSSNREILEARLQRIKLHSVK